MLDVKLTIPYRESLSESGKTFFEEVRSKLGSSISCDRKVETVIVDDIEPGCDEEFVGSALANALGVPASALQLGKLVTGRRGNRLIFVKMEPQLARRATRMQYLALQWTRARIRRKIDPDFCGNCQTFGHLARDCKVERAAKRCRNCGSGDHLLASCKNETSCYSCKERGHRADSMACPKYRALVSAKAQKC